VDESLITEGIHSIGFHNKTKDFKNRSYPKNIKFQKIKKSVTLRNVPEIIRATIKDCPYIM